MALVIQSKAAKDARSLPRQDWEGLKERLERIARDPYGSHRDVKSFDGGFRVRHGDWRAIYVINGRGDVEVVKVGHRREIYRR